MAVRFFEPNRVAEALGERERPNLVLPIVAAVALSLLCFGFKLVEEFELVELPPGRPPTSWAIAFSGGLGLPALVLLVPWLVRRLPARVELTRSSITKLRVVQCLPLVGFTVRRSVWDMDEIRAFEVERLRIGDSTFHVLRLVRDGEVVGAIGLDSESTLVRVEELLRASGLKVSVREKRAPVAV